MLDRLFSTGSLPALEAMLTFASARHRVIAQNIANVDTPGYRARDLSEREFRKTLADAFAAPRVSFPPRFGTGPAADAGALKPGGNNVDLELEMAKMVKNTVLHTTASALLAHQFAVLREAVAGRVIG